MNEITPFEGPEPLFVIITGEGEIYEVESPSWSSLVITSSIQQPRPFTLTSEGFTELSDAETNEIPF